MNERIRQLLNEATVGLEPDLSPQRTVTLNEMEKFAELIVRDCLDIAFEVRGKPATDTHYVIGYDRACEKMIDAIKESYGVEK